jgi:uncharacterized membrane protein
MSRSARTGAFFLSKFVMSAHGYVSEPEMIYILANTHGKQSITISIKVQAGA